MGDTGPARRQRAATDRPPRCGRQSSAENASLTTLARLVAQAAGVPDAIVDEHYTVAAVMLEQTCCGSTHTLLVELLEDHQRTDDQRWTAIAYDELDQRQAQPSIGPTAKDAVLGIGWCQLAQTGT